jgi:hypothetical protein
VFPYVDYRGGRYLTRSSTTLESQFFSRGHKGIRYRALKQSSRTRSNPTSRTSSQFSWDTNESDIAHLKVTQLRWHMTCLRPVSATRHSSPATFVHKDLDDCTHVFLRQDATRRALEPPLQRPLPGPLAERERKRCSFLYVASLSLCLPIGSSQLMCCTSPTTVAPH